MANVLAWTLLFDGVVKYFADEKIFIPNLFGWKKPGNQPSMPSRIVWVPGDDASGNIGKFLPPKNPGRLPERPLATLDEIFTIYCVGADSIDRTDERRQYTAARLVLDTWFRAMYYAASAEGLRGRFAVLGGAWKTEIKERPNGGGIRLLVTAEAMIPDAPASYVSVDTTAELQGSLQTGVNADPPTPPIDSPAENDGGLLLIPEPPES